MSTRGMRRASRARPPRRRTSRPPRKHPGGTMPYLVELRQVAPQLLAVVRDVATSDTLVQKILGSPVWTYLGKHGIKSGGHNIVVYFDEGRPEFRIGIGASVPAPLAGTPALTSSP